MSLIPHSNIRVDNFEFMKNDLTSYIFFLSHCHEDHIKGLTPSWNYGKIYTSHISKILIVDRFPHLKDYVIELEMDEEHWLYLDDSKKEGVSVMMMDAFHCPGAVMFLFRGKMGTVFHTGDFRFSEQMFDNEILFPPSKRNPQMKQISVDIDYLFLDNTFADPEYDFPSREEAYKSLTDTIKSHKDHRIFLFSYNLGKEEVFVNLAQDFETLVVVDEDRFRKLSIMDLRPDLFTTDEKQGWIHIKSIRELKKFDIEKCNEEEPTIFIIMTGWNDKYNRNLPYYFKVPYSSHSNYREIERFVKAMMPKNLVFNVPERAVSEKRLQFQHHLLKSYVKRDKQNLQNPVLSNPKKGYVLSYNSQATQSIQNTLKSGNSQFNQGFKSQFLEEHKDHNQSKEVGVSSGYDCGDNNLSERFNVNNKEMNKKRFLEANANIFKSKQNGNKPRGAKFTNKEISLSLTPQGDEFDKLLNESSELFEKVEHIPQSDHELLDKSTSAQSLRGQQLREKSDQKMQSDQKKHDQDDQNDELLLHSDEEDSQGDQSKKIDQIAKRLFDNQNNYEQMAEKIPSNLHKKRRFQEIDHSSAHIVQQKSQIIAQSLDKNFNSDQLIQQNQKRMKIENQSSDFGPKTENNGAQPQKINFLKTDLITQLRQQYAQNKQEIQKSKKAV